MAKQILIVDNESANINSLTTLLNSAGYSVQGAHSEEEAIEQLNRESPDLIILDFAALNTDGCSICRYIDQQSGFIPVLLLTSKDDAWEQVAGLQVGADAYMTKPFGPGQLLAQVKALLRLVDNIRLHLAKDPSDYERPLICNSLVLYRQQHKVELNDTEIELSPKEFDLLQFFMQQPGRVFDRETLLQHIWGYDFLGGTRTVDTHIQRLRVKIEADSTNPQLLQTVRGFGYRLICTE